MKKFEEVFGMMKKISIFFLALILMFSMAGCGAESDPQTSGPADRVESETDTEPTDTTGADETELTYDADMKDVTNDKEPAGEVGVFDLEQGTVLLNSGYEMPILGIGCFRISQEEAENSVYWALRDGYRLIDTARIYGNEVGVGRGIQKAIDEGFVTREEIFVTTKMWTDDYDDGAAAVDASLDRLGLDYIDDRVIIGTS